MSNGEPSPSPEVRPTTPAPKPSDASFGIWLFRAIILALVLGSVAVLWWSFALVMSPKLKESRELSTRVARLSSAVDDLDRQWTTEAAGEVSNQLSRADSKLFEGQAEFEAWLANFKQQAAPLALDVKTSLGQPSQQTAGDRTMTLIPATVTLEIQPARPDTQPSSPYALLLLLGRRLAAEPKRADLEELTIEAGTNSLSRAVLVLNAWTRKEGKP